MLNWLISTGIDFKSLFLTVFGAAAGAFFKWLLDRNQIDRLEGQISGANEERKKLDNKLEQSLTKIAEQETLLNQKQIAIEKAEGLLHSRGAKIEHEESKLRTLLSTLRDSETSLWTKYHRQPRFTDHDVRVGRHRPIILTIANLKGGVGKTTLTGNLVAHFDRIGKRVLAIDLDYQGSLTTMLRAFGDPAKRISSVNKFFEPGASVKWIWQATRPLGPQLTRSRLASAFYEFARYEEYLMMEWLLQQGGDDLRFRLASLLLDDDVQESFDVILIDVPPRLTTGTINALCTSTHVIVPTIFNPLSAEPVANFVGMAKNLADHLNPNLEFIGVLETMSPRSNVGQDVRAAGRRTITEALQRSFPNLEILETNIPHRSGISEAKLAALNGSREIRGIFNRVGCEIQQRVGL